MSDVKLGHLKKMCVGGGNKRKGERSRNRKTYCKQRAAQVKELDSPHVATIIEDKRSTHA